jgi:hypothetical protein
MVVVLHRRQVLEHVHHRRQTSHQQNFRDLRL